MMKKFLAYMLTPTALLVIMLMMNIGVVLYHFNNKIGFHSDEQWSYAHANSTKGAYLDAEIDSYYRVNDNIAARLFHQKIDGSVLNEYLTVQKDEKFSYQHIYENLKIVEHPPLYFLLLHTVSSFFPDEFSKWHAGAINLALFILIYFALFKVSEFVLKDWKLALCSTALWGFSEIGIDTVIFLRMYILQTLLSLCLVYEVIKVINDNHASNKQFLLIFIYSFLGIFTQYNSIFFSFFVTLAGCIIFLKRKNYKLMFQFGSVMTLSVVILFVVFPPAYDVLFTSMRGTQVLFNIGNIPRGDGTSVMSLFYNADIKMSYVMEMISEHFFAFHDTYHKIIAFVFIIGLFMSIYLKIKINTPTGYLLSVVVLYSLYLLSMPYMHIFHSRYYMSIMPFVAVLFVSLIRQILIFSGLSKNTITTIVAIIVSVNSLCLNFSVKSPYAFRWGENEYKIFEKIKDNEVFINHGSVFIPLHSMVYYMRNARGVFIGEDICHPEMLEHISASEKPVIFVYASYIFSSLGKSNIKCLKEIGFSNSAKICASQHCYDVWEKR